MFQPRPAPPPPEEPALFSARDLDDHRPALIAHAYRMTASASDADDAVQDAMVRAWRARERFRGESSLRTWLLRIVTRTSLDLLAKRQPRLRPTDLGWPGTTHDELEVRGRSAWVEPIADAEVLDPSLSPEEALASRRHLRLAFVAALQRLPARQRAVLLLADGCGWRAPEIADTLGMTPAAVNSALQRARATLGGAGGDGSDGSAGFAPDPLEPAQARLLDAYLAAFEAYDVDALLAVLREDVTLCMPPYALWLRGHADVRAWLLGRGIGCRGSRLLRVAANGTCAFGQYRPGGSGGAYLPWSLILLETDGGKITSIIHFLDAPALFPRMGLPERLPPLG
ncbi:MAG: RNA polymerase subunit sigma-70 [Myxococcales bacterium]|nr:RNA polymerase subunit sigma-70 [Myxococcales bacterium]MCB9568343.1 RNA polymerase subunit sigma-70 [Myxococcales bacterium]MCB9705067.1 RNA polymerase subunit sigma-70 [Myxococcales bacterium]